MKSLVFTAIAGVLVLFFLLLPQPDATSQLKPVATAVSDATSNSFVLGPVKVFDGQQWRKERYVEVRDGRVQQLHPDKPDSTLPLIDGHNQWLMPGLIDAHVHAWGDALQQALNFGVTTALDMFGDQQFLVAQKAARAGTERTDQADMYGAGVLVTAPKGHGTQYGIEIPVIERPEQASDFVAARLAEGSDYIKIVYTSAKALRHFRPSIDLATLQAVIDAAKAQGLLAVVHIADLPSAEEAIAAGADGLVHSFFSEPVSDELLQLMASGQRFVIPTMTVMEGMLANQINEELLLQDPPALLTAAAISSLQQRFGNAQIPPERYQLLAGNTKKMAEAGILLLAGSDAPNPNTAHGVSLLVEMVLLQRAGVPNLQVLQSATSAPAKAFGLQEVGYLRPGYKADMLLLSQDPMAELTTLLTPAAIWKNGWLHQPELPAESTAVTAGLIADFNTGLTARSGGFAASSDSMMQGKSSAEIRVQQGALQVTGTTRPGFAYPWAGVAWQTADSMETGSNFSDISHIKFTIRGTPGQYRLDAFSAGSFMPVSHRFAVTADWQTIELPLSAFSGLNTEAVSMLLWNGPEGEFQFELDDIELR
ncbi:Imidazolonepropionase [Arsukibacterium tuosuense]|uniref:Imidazolonepropionase n=1 Tax=Arsukibacterium tuosuense TaxID=1323745 RepID=A0A285IM46_9GAMM|nr:amidohydrolase family protein [Arsukibacterium tuosuense]SNY49090.1 Imidazolonepropionase [Arsukibacterium tuosuense]